MRAGAVVLASLSMFHVASCSDDPGARGRLPGQRWPATGSGDGASATSTTSAGSFTGDTTGDATTGTTSGTPTAEEEPPEVCYPGPDGDWSTCPVLERHDPLPEGYDYPPPLADMPGYRAPVALLDLDAVDPATWLAPDFRLDELAQLHKGRWAVVQPHAVAALQAMRDDVGPLRVTSGYRSPAFNRAVGGAEHSRHLYGDAFDLDPLASTLAAVEDACEAYGGVAIAYDTHVHCDWRDDPLDERFFGTLDDPDARGGVGFGPQP